MNKSTYVFLTACALPALMANSAAAQGAAAPVCLAGSTSEWISGTADASTLGATPLSKAVSFNSGGRAMLAFNVTGDAREIRLEIGNNTTGDPMLRLYSATGEQLAEADDYEGNLASRVEQKFEPGTYCLLASDVTGAALTATVQISEMSAEPIVTPGGSGVSQIAACTAETAATTLDAAAFATALTERTSVSNSQAGADGAQYYRFSLPPNANLRLTARSEALDPTIVLFNAGGESVAENDDADGTNSRIDLLGSLPAGNYCLGVAPLSSGDGTITVSAGGVNPDDILREAAQNGTIPPTAASGYPITALDILKTEPQTVLLGAQAHWFAFDVPERQVVVINAYGSASGIDTQLRLFSAFGANIEENDDANGGTDPQIGPVILDAGSYRLALTEVGDSNAQARAVSLGVQRFVQPK